MLTIPELELVLQNGTLGGVFTTVEGMLSKIRQSLLDSNPFAVGDSTTKHHSADTSISSVSLISHEINSGHCHSYNSFTLIKLFPIFSC
jgi:C4-type Zn-finger protein